MQAKLNASTVKRLTGEAKPYEVVDAEIKGFLMRVQPTGRKTFYFSYRNDAGKRKRIKLGVLGSSLTLAQARDMAITYAGKVAAGADVQGERATARHSARERAKNNLGNFMEEHYLPWALANLKSGQQTVDSVKRSFRDYLGAPLVDIQLSKIERWRISKLNDGLKPSTVNRVVNALRAVLTKAVEWEVITEHPLAKLKPIRIDGAKKARFLSDGEEARLYQALKDRDEELKQGRARGNQHRAERGYDLLPDLSHFAYGDRMTPLVILSLKTGMRRGELFDLTWDAIDLPNNVVTAHGDTTKSSKTRHIPLSPKAIEAIENWRRQAPNKTGRVFPADDGGRLDNVRNSWSTILEKARIESFRWHDMRHDFASKLVMRGVPLNTVRELCGHADLNTTLRYAHLAPDHKADAIAMLG